LGLSGLRASARFASVCAILGMLLPIGLLIVFAIAWVAGGHPMAIHFSWDSMIPALNKTQSWVSLTAIITAFLGMELAAVHVRNIQDPQRNFPRAIFCSAILIVVTMLLGSLAIAIILPKNEIGLVQGIPQAFTYFFNYYHLSFLTPIIIFAILLSGLGSMINWIISPAKGLLMAADHGILPKWFHKLNRHGIASRVLLSQAVLVTFICGIFLLLQSINEIYWLFTVLSTELYVLMYVLMLVAAIRLKHSHGDKPRPFAVFGGKPGYYFTCGVGILGCVLALVIGFFPPEEALAINNVLHFRIIFSIGIILMLTPAGLLLWRHKSIK